MNLPAMHLSNASRRRLVSLAGAGAIVVTLALLSQSPSEASPLNSLFHIGLASSIPAKDAHVMTTPKELRLTFTGVVNVATAGVELAAADGKKVALDSLRAVPDSNKVAVAKITGALTKGTYTVTWRAKAADGANGTGTYNFMYMPADNR